MLQAHALEYRIIHMERVTIPQPRTAVRHDREQRRVIFNFWCLSANTYVVSELRCAAHTILVRTYPHKYLEAYSECHTRNYHEYPLTLQVCSFVHRPE